MQAGYLEFLNILSVSEQEIDQPPSKSENFGRNFFSSFGFCQN